MLALSLGLSVFGCSSDKEGNTATTTAETSATEEDTAVSLDGKKIIFIGNSFVFYGNAVLEVGTEFYAEEHRLNDQGYFYQLCKAKGAEVSVTNWTFGMHSLNNFCQRVCQNNAALCKGINHFDQLTDKYYDYVVISGGRSESMPAETFLDNVQTIKDIFTEANPNVKLVYLCCSGSHNISVDRTFPVQILNELKTVEKMGYTVADWGKLVADVINGETEVPGATLEFTKNSFVISRTEKDGYHPNQLSGYITALMTYCAITGESAVGQPYDFCADQPADSVMNFDSYIEKNYAYGEDGTNYPEIFASAADMKGIQELIDRTLEEKAFREYNFTLE